MDNFLRKLTSPQKDYLVAHELNGLMDISNIDQAFFDKYYNSVSIPYYRNLLLKKYTHYKTIRLTGYDSTKMKLYDLSQGDTSSLWTILKENHAGKVVYADVWATWCGSCISNFHYMPQLKEQFKQVDIEFVYLAVASDKELWLTDIKKYNLSGTHYFLNPTQVKELKTRIPYSGIPRYFIIDRDGKVTIPEAKMPGDHELINQIKGSLIKQEK